MNKKRRLLWSFAPLATLAAFAPVAISASCGRKGRVIPNLDLIKGQTNWSVVNSKYTEDSYTTDLSTTYGGFLNRFRRRNRSLFTYNKKFRKLQNCSSWSKRAWA